MRFDYHLHTTFSSDGKQTPEELIFAAKANGLDDIIVTEHCECQPSLIPEGFGEWNDTDLEAYVKTFSKLRENYDMGIGIELGQATQAPEIAEKCYNFYEWDIVLGSLHNLRNGYDFYYYDHLGLSVKDDLHEYYAQLYEVAEQGMYSVLSHLTYPIKSFVRNGREFDLKPFYSDIEQILRYVTERGKGIELNLSPMFSCKGATMPDLDVLKLYRSLGGEILTTGSDSHASFTVGKYNADALELLQTAGFKYITKFRKMIPQQIKIK